MEYIALAILILLYFAPFLIAYKRDHNESLMIFWINFLLGWTAIGWLAAFFFSLSSNVRR